MYSEYKSAQFANKGVPCLTKNLIATPRFEQTSKKNNIILFNVIIFVFPLWRFYTKVHIPVKEVQFMEINETKYFQNCTSSPFTLKKRKQNPYGDL